MRTETWRTSTTKMNSDIPHNLADAILSLIPLRLDEIEIMSLKVPNEQINLHSSRT